MILPIILLVSGARAAIDNVDVLVSAEGVGGLSMPSPWALTLRQSTLYFSNFGAPGLAQDYVGVLDIKAGGSEGGRVFAVQKDITVAQGESLDALHVRSLVTDKAGHLFLASYAGPAGAVIAKCTGASQCAMLVPPSQLPFSNAAQLQLSALAYSESLDRIFYALADGAAEKSAIYSVPASGGSAEVYVEQSMADGTAFPVGLAIDEERGYVYWSNGAGPDRIQRGDLVAGAATDVGVLYAVKGDDDAGFRPHHIALDAEGEWLFFTDQEKHVVGKVDLRALNTAEELYKTPNNGLPHGIVVDVENQQVIWSETGNSNIKKGKETTIGVSRVESGSMGQRNVVGTLLLLGATLSILL